MIRVSKMQGNYPVITLCGSTRFKDVYKRQLIDPDKQVSLELWAYNPKPFSEDNSADDISLVLSFTDTNDERITFLYDREHTIGHAFFTGLKDDASPVSYTHLDVYKRQQGW